MSILDGISNTDLQARLSALQQVYLDLSAGSQVATASYTQGDGSKSVTFRAADIGAVITAIQMIQKQLGITIGRKPVRVAF